MCRFIISLLFVGFLSFAYSQSYSRCSYEKMRRCKDTLDRSLQKRINDMSRHDSQQHCNVVREDFNCLIQQTQCLSSNDEKRRNGDVIRNSLVYIRDGCDVLGTKWKDSSCYVGNEMKTCETTYPVHSGQFSSSSTSNCRTFTQFYDCVTHTLKTRCRAEDDRFLGQYLVDKVQELAWECPDPNSAPLNDKEYERTRDRDSSHREYGNDRSGRPYDRDRDDRYDSDRRHDDRYGSDRYGSGSTLNERDICCQYERCDNYKLEQCRDSLNRVIDERHGSGYQQDEQKCRKIRNDFNCLLWQTSCLQREQRDRNSDVFRRARDYISRSCDTYGRWNENNCYKSSEMQRCETYLSNTRSGANYEACSNFMRFKECVTDALERRCAREDSLFMGAYLVEKAQEMAWQCDNSDRRNNYGGSDSYRDRDRDRGSYYQDRRNDYNTGSIYGPAYDENQHLSDDDEMCVSRLQGYIDICKREMDEKRRQLLTENEYDVKVRGRCCSARRYRSCLADATRRACQRERYNVVEKVLGSQARNDINRDECRRIYDSDCDSSTSLIASTLLTFSALIASLVLLSF